MINQHELLMLQYRVKYNMFTTKRRLKTTNQKSKTCCDEELELKTLDDFKLRDAYSIILNGIRFVKNIAEGTKRILLFTKTKKLKWFQEAKFWIMDGTLKTVSNIVSAVVQYSRACRWKR